MGSFSEQGRNRWRSRTTRRRSARPPASSIGENGLTMRSIARLRAKPLHDGTHHLGVGGHRFIAAPRLSRLRFEYQGPSPVDRKRAAADTRPSSALPADPPGRRGAARGRSTARPARRAPSRPGWPGPPAPPAAPPAPRSAVPTATPAAASPADAPTPANAACDAIQTAPRPFAALLHGLLALRRLRLRAAVPPPPASSRISRASSATVLLRLEGSRPEASQIHRYHRSIYVQHFLLPIYT